MSEENIKFELMMNLLNDNDMLSRKIYDSREEIMGKLLDSEIIDGFLKETRTSRECKHLLEEFMVYIRKHIKNMKTT